MKNTNTPKMKWYNFLVYFWLPINIFFNLLLTVLMWRMFTPVITALFSFKYEVIPTKGTELFLLIYLLLFMCVLPLVFTIIVRENLRKFTPRAPKLLSYWYILPVLLNMGVLLITNLFGDNSDFMVFIMPMVVFGIIKALVMILSNNLYFYKRAAFFEKRPEGNFEE